LCFSTAGHAPYALGVTPDEVDEFARSLPGCKRKGTAVRPAWYVDNRLVARLVDPGEHMKVQVLLDGDTNAIREAIQLAWQMQRR
jgi:hypothetical protein